MAPAHRPRISIRVKANARRARVGGLWPPREALVVAVAAPATQGRANEAVLEALARALRVPRRTLSISHGSRSRDKTVEVRDPPPDLEQRVDRLKALE